MTIEAMTPIETASPPSASAKRPWQTPRVILGTDLAGAEAGAVGVHHDNTFGTGTIVS